MHKLWVEWEYFKRIGFDRGPALEFVISFY